MSGRVLVDDHCLTNRGGGIRTYTESLFHHWPRDAAVQLVGFRGVGAAPATGATRPAAAARLRPLAQLLDGNGYPQDGSHRRAILFHAYRAAFSVHALLGQYDAVFEPNNLCPTARLPMIATLHDLSVIEHPEWHTAGRVARWKRCLPVAVRHTRQWICPSAFTRDRMVKLLHLKPENVHVIPEAARSLPRPAAESPLSAQRYFLYVGTIEPRKNISMLLDAYATLPREVREQHRLLFVGPTGWGPPEFWQALVHHPMAGEALVTGYLPDAALAAAYAHAVALLLPSFYEGFGLQLLEAMAAGCPVACSDIPVFREVAGASAELLSPFDVASWSELMRRAIQDQGWHGARSMAGLARAAQFSWQTAARSHAELFAEVVRTSR